MLMIEQTIWFWIIVIVLNFISLSFGIDFIKDVTGSRDKWSRRAGYFICLASGSLILVSIAIIVSLLRSP